MKGIRGTKVKGIGSLTMVEADLLAQDPDQYRKPVLRATAAQVADHHLMNKLTAGQGVPKISPICAANAENRMF